MSPSLQRPTRRTAFAMLMLASLITLFLPPNWTDPLKHVGQLLVAPADLLTSASYRASKSMARFDSNDSGDSGGREALLIQLAAQSAAIQQLQDENAMLRRLRTDMVPPPIPILPARIVSNDVVAWRDSIIVARGSIRGVSWHDWVATRLFVDQGQSSGVWEGQAVLGREVLLGRIEQVSPYMSRVQLFTDIDVRRLEVRIGGKTGDRFEFVNYPCSLRGAGHGQMLIEGVDYRYVQQAGSEDPIAGRRIHLGDLVFSAPGELGLPTPMSVGKVRELREDPRKRLVYSIVVEPLVSTKELRDVQIIPIVPTASSRS